MRFLQVIDCKTSRVHELNQLMDTWVAQTHGKRTATHSIVGQDRARPGHYVEIVEFASYEDAALNSRLPETDQVFQDMTALCDEPPVFTDLDVIRDEQLNKATVHRFFAEIGGRNDLECLAEILTCDYLDHEASRDEATVGLDGLVRDVNEYRAGFDFAFTLQQQLAEGDEVATRWTWQATHKGDFRGIPATGRAVEMDGQTMFRLRDGRICESWWSIDSLGLLQQLAAGDR